MKVKIKALHPDAQMPVYATDGSGAFDLHSITEGDTAVITGESRSFRTGLAIEVPKGHLMFVLSRSGHGFKHATRLANCIGLIDSDYRGEVMVRLTRDFDSAIHPMTVKHGDRIAQAVILPVEQVDFEWVDELSATDRGDGGFGSTGA